jgi:hypothetical protein
MNEAGIHEGEGSKHDFVPEMAFTEISEFDRQKGPNESPQVSRQSNSHFETDAQYYRAKSNGNSAMVLRYT